MSQETIYTAFTEPAKASPSHFLPGELGVRQTAMRVFDGDFSKSYDPTAGLQH